MNNDNEEIELFYKNLNRFIELSYDLHIDYYITENPKGRGDEVLMETYSELKKEIQEEQELAKEICYSLFRLVENENFQILFKPKRKNKKIIEQKGE